MAERTPQSVSKLIVFRAYLASDGKTPATGKTIAVTISKNGATSFSNPAAGATNATEMASGFYKFTLGAGDVDTLGPLAWRGAEGTINDAGDVVEVVKATNAGFSALPDAAAEASGGLPTLSAAQASNGTIQANVHRWLTGTPNALQSGRVDSSIGAVAAGVIAAASFAANALDAVWSTATRVLTAGTNIVLAKGTGVTGFNDLSASDVRSEVAGALGDFDFINESDLNDLGAAVVTDVLAGITVDHGSGSYVRNTEPPSESDNATGLLDLAAGVETGLTLRQALRLIAAASAGKLSGAETTTVVIRNAVADSKNRITATVDADGNRSAITLDLT